MNPGMCRITQFYKTVYLVMYVVHMMKSAVESFTIDSDSYHVYKKVWSSAVGEKHCDNTITCMRLIL